MRIIKFEDQYQSQVINLIVNIQRAEFKVEITAEQQPDLSSIPEYYQMGRGNFWIALEGDEVIGTIALRDIGNNEGALRKMFVAQSYRGSEHGTAGKLLAALLEWAQAQDIATIYLGTIEKFRAAHKFYEKNGFRLIEKDQLPSSFPLMGLDTRFYRWSPLSRNT